MIILLMFEDTGEPKIDERTGNHMTHIGLSLDEEKELARAVFGLLCQRNFRGDDREFLEQVYADRAGRAWPLWSDTFVEIIEIIQRWTKLDWFDFVYPPFLKSGIIDNSATNDNKENRLDQFVIEAWKEIWGEYYFRLIKLSDGYKNFAGQYVIERWYMLRKPDPYLEQALIKEQKFWNEIDRIQNDMNMSPSDTYDWVRDYTKRGRDMIPRVLMRHWIEMEPLAIEEFGGYPHPEEDWVSSALAYSYREEQLMPPSPTDKLHGVIKSPDYQS